MSQTNSTREDSNTRVMKATGKLVEGLSPWLIDVGTWIFGGLIALNLILLGALLTIGPVDPAVVVATTAFALVLPLDVTGLILLRLVQDLQHVEFEVQFENEVRQAIQTADPNLGIQDTSPSVLEAVRKRRTSVALLHSFGILTLSLTLSLALTLVGLFAVFWHMDWWIAVAFAVMVVISFVLVTLALVNSKPPLSAEEREQWKRYSDLVSRQANERAAKE